MDLIPDGRYLGPVKYSYVPEGLVPYTAAMPGPLCTRCSTLDIPGYFTESPTEETSGSLSRIFDTTAPIHEIGHRGTVHGWRFKACGGLTQVLHLHMACDTIFWIFNRKLTYILLLVS